MKEIIGQLSFDIFGFSARFLFANSAESEDLNRSSSVSEVAQ
jgi:hypothetical protein